MIHLSNFENNSDSYPMFKKLREQKPVYFEEHLGLWIITRYGDVRRVLKDSATFSNSLTFAPIFPVCPHAIKIMSQIPMTSVAATSDAPDHTRLRNAMNAVFPKSTEQTKKYESLIQNIVNELLERKFQKAEVDLVNDFSKEISLRVMISLLGIPNDDFYKIKDWLDGSVLLNWGKAEEEEQIKLAQNLSELIPYCYEQTNRRVNKPSNDLISMLLAYRNGDDQVLTIAEIANTVFAFLAAGHETTTNLIANGIFQLLRTGEWSHIAQDQNLVPQAIEETLRFDTPIVGWLRNTIQDTHFDEIIIPANQRVLVLIGSANHDNEIFVDAEEFVIRRNDSSKHISFSVGRHYCIGANLARLEAEVAFKTLLSHFPHMQLEPNFTPKYSENMSTRSLRELSVIL